MAADPEMLLLLLLYSLSDVWHRPNENDTCYLSFRVKDIAFFTTHGRGIYVTGREKISLNVVTLFIYHLESGIVVLKCIQRIQHIRS